MRVASRIIVLAAMAALAGCAHDVAMHDPQSGTDIVCRASLAGFDPWSQTEACIAGHMAEGWIKEDRD